MKGSHHVTIYDDDGNKIGHLRIRNDDYIISAWILGQLLLNPMGEEE
jgi:hypothetical protein